MEHSQASAPEIRSDLQIAVIIPCRNEAAAIASVVSNFRSALPTASIFVYDNNSEDDTADVAREAGAIVRREQLPGKGNVVRRMFADIDADVYVLVDGDDTYDAASAGRLVAHLEDNILDMVTGVRVPVDDDSYRPGHKFGNFFLTRIVSMVFGSRSTDLLSGYRIFSRRFVKSFPALTSGFEIETELTVHALELRMPIGEVDTPYSSRPDGSESNLRTVHDGLRILRTIGWLAKSEKPLPFFGLIFAIFATAALVLAWPVFTTYLETGLVPRFPTAILSTGLMLLAFLSIACGIILDTVTRGRQELKRLHYLSIARHRRGSRD
ncbi:MAG: glycosyltransferase family 2 protein [Pseudomonadota bacterium]